MNHRNTTIGAFKVQCISDQFWTVAYNGTVLCSSKYRYIAVARAKALVNACKNNPNLKGRI